MQELLIAVAAFAVGGGGVYIFTKVKNSADPVKALLPWVKRPKLGDLVYDRTEYHHIVDLFDVYNRVTGERHRFLKFENDNFLKTGLVRDLEWDKERESWTLPGRQGPKPVRTQVKEN